MFKERSNQKELMDDFELSDPLLKKNLSEIEWTNRWFGSQQCLLSGLQQVYASNKKVFRDKPISIVDIGCGSGDLLHAIDKWAKANVIIVNLTGIDANQYMLDAARVQCKSLSNIQYLHANVFSDAFSEMSFDIITLSSFCHHLTNDELIFLIKQCIKQARTAIIINDLHRHWISYYGIKSIAHFGNFSSLAKNDGPLSVLRGFKKKELIALLKQCSLTHYSVNWNWLFRWQIIIWCNQLNKDRHNDSYC